MSLNDELDNVKQPKVSLYCLNLASRVCKSIFRGALNNRSAELKLLPKKAKDMKLTQTERHHI